LVEVVTAKPSFRRLISNRPFSLLWIGQLVSQSGDFIFDVAALWLVAGDTFKVGLVIAVISLASVIVGPLAGVYVDKFNRRDLIVGSNILQAITVATIAVLYSLGQLSFPLLLVLLFILNSGALFVRPAVTATIPGMMGKEDLAAANGLFSVSSSLNQIAGYGIGGVIILLFGVVVPIYYDSITFIFAAALTALITRSLLRIPSATSDPNDLNLPSSFREKFIQGLRFIKSSRLLVQLILLALVLNFFAGAIQTLIAPYSKTTLNGNAGTYGIMLAAFSLGTIIGALLIGKIESRKYVGKLLFLGVFVAGASIALMGLTTISLVAIGLMALTGASLAFANLPIQVLLQVEVPGHLLGRVITSLGALVIIAVPIAAVTTGTVASTIQIGPSLQLFGFLLIVATAVGYAVFRDVREAKY
jgi:MFS transporter, DHA3 family, macrolide efflux protein